MLIFTAYEPLEEQLLNYCCQWLKDQSLFNGCHTISPLKGRKHSVHYCWLQQVCKIFYFTTTGKEMVTPQPRNEKWETRNQKYNIIRSILKVRAGSGALVINISQRTTGSNKAGRISGKWGWKGKSRLMDPGVSIKATQQRHEPKLCSCASGHVSDQITGQQHMCGKKGGSGRVALSRLRTQAVEEVAFLLVSPSFPTTTQGNLQPLVYLFANSRVTTTNSVKSLNSCKILDQDRETDSTARSPPCTDLRNKVSR